jgi:hypothetical protein
VVLDEEMAFGVAIWELRGVERENQREDFPEFFRRFTRERAGHNDGAVCADAADGARLERVSGAVMNLVHHFQIEATLEATVGRELAEGSALGMDGCRNLGDAE